MQRPLVISFPPQGAVQPTFGTTDLIILKNLVPTEQKAYCISITEVNRLMLFRGNSEHQQKEQHSVKKT
jgi:hypothetical protein